MLANIRTFCRSLSQHPDSRDEAGNPIEEHSKQWNIAQNMTDWCSYLAFDVMGDLCFGKGFALLESNENRFAVDLTSNASRRHLIVSSTDLMLRIHSNLKKCGTLPMIHEYHLDKLLFHKIAAGRARYMAYSKSQAAARMKLGHNTDRKDFFYYLLHAKDQETGKGFSQPELWGESNLLM